MAARFVLKNGLTGKFRFNLVAANGEIATTNNPRSQTGREPEVSSRSVGIDPFFFAHGSGRWPELRILAGGYSGLVRLRLVDDLGGSGDSAHRLNAALPA